MLRQGGSLFSTPGRATAVGALLVAGAAALVGIGYAAGWLRPEDAAAAATAAPAPPPVEPTAAQQLWRLLVAIAVICALATLCGRLARRIGQPAVVGEIVAGLLLGPSVIGSAAPWLFEAVLPAEVRPNLGLLAQAGLAVFMFTIGSDFGSDRIGRDRGAIAAASFAIMTVPFALGLLVALPLYSTLAGPDVHRLPFAVFIGTALSITAFPVLARIVEDCGLHGTRLGSLAMLCAAVADVLAWCALAVTMALIRSAGVGDALLALGLTIVLGAAAVFVLRPLLQRLAHRYAADVPTPILVLLVLGLILGLAAATDHIGVHAIFGGFLAGLVLPKNSLPVTGVAEQIGGLNRALLVPVFFASIGLQTDITAAVSQPAVLGAGAVLLVVAVVGKLAGSVPVARAGGLPGRSAAGLGVLMNARGITEIVVLSAGLGVGIINRSAFTVLVVMALVTTTTAAPLLRRLGPSLRDHAVPDAVPDTGADTGAATGADKRYAGGDATSTIP